MLWRRTDHFFVIIFIIVILVQPEREGPGPDPELFQLPYAQGSFALGSFNDLGGPFLGLLYDQDMIRGEGDCFLSGQESNQHRR